MINEQNLKVVLTQLYRQGISKDIIQSLYSYIIKAPQEDLLAVNPNYIAVKIGIQRWDILNLIVQAVLNRLFEMEWDVNCPRCKGIADHADTLGHVHENAYCPACEVKFPTYADENITVTVSMHPSLFEGDAPKPPEMRALDERVQPVKAIDLVGVPAFRQNFGNQAPDLDHSVKIRSVTVMFTDLIHSTQLYSSIGDLKAYTLVKSHFDVLFEQIVTNSGGVIKTIGDAVMAVFQNTVTPLETAFKIKHAVNHLLEKEVQEHEFGVRIGLSTGPALIVNMNNTLDLFGTTINLAARVVSLSDAKTVSATKNFIKDAQIQLLISQDDFSVTTLKEKLKGIPGESDIYLLSKQNLHSH